MPSHPKQAKPTTKSAPKKASGKSHAPAPAGKGHEKAHPTPAPKPQELVKAVTAHAKPAASPPAFVPSTLAHGKHPEPTKNSAPLAATADATKEFKEKALENLSGDLNEKIRYLIRLSKEQGYLT